MHGPAVGNLAMGAAVSTMDVKSAVAGAAVASALTACYLTGALGGAVAGVATGGAYRGKIEKLSAEVVDSNPYSRLMALQRMQVVKNYEAIRGKTVSSLYAV